MQTQPMVNTPDQTYTEASPEAVRDRLNALFVDSGFKNKDLAQYVGVSAQAVGKWKRDGQVARRHIPAICAFFGREPDCLLRPLTQIEEDAAQYQRQVSIEETIDLVDRCLDEAGVPADSEIRRAPHYGELIKIMSSWNGDESKFLDLLRVLVLKAT